MKKRLIQMVAVLVLFIGGIGFVKFQQIQAAMAAGKSYQPPPEAVTTIVAAPVQWAATIEAVGSVAPTQGVMLSADLPGVVAKIAFESGAAVRAGQPLVMLDATQERAQLASAEARRDLAKTNLDRARRLLEQQVVSQAEYDQLAAQFKETEASVAEVAAAIERKTIRAPFSGITGIRQVNLGQYLRSGDPVVALESRDRVYVDFAVPQEQVYALKVGATVHAHADSVSRARLTGRITAISPVVDDATRNGQVQATFDNAHGALRSGMYVTVDVTLGAGARVVALPSSAISFAPYGNSVFIVENMKGPNGATYRGVRQQFVKLGDSQGDRVAVLEGVSAGQEVVTSGVFKLRSGAAVLVNNAVQPSNESAPKPEDS